MSWRCDIHMKAKSMVYGIQIEILKFAELEMYFILLTAWLLLNECKKSDFVASVA